MRALLTLLCLFFLSTFTQARQTQEIERIVGNNSPDDFANFINSAPNPDYTGDATYSITLATVIAGGGLDFPLVLTYNSNAVRESAQSGYVGFGWDLNIGEVVRAVNHVPDEQYRSFFGVSEDFHLGGNLGGAAWHAEQDGIIAGGDAISGTQEADEWDNYNLSTPYGGANLVPSKPSDGITPFYFLEKPYRNGVIQYTRAGLNQYFSKFDFTDDLGRKFKFDYAHYARADFNGDGVKGVNDTKYYRYPTSWKLTRIDSPNSDHYVDIEYDDYAHAGSSITSGVNTPYETTSPKHAMILAGKTLPGDIFVRTTYDESVVDYIETLTHKINFFYQDDPTNIGTNGIKRKLLNRIEVRSKKNSQIVRQINLSYNTNKQHKATITYTLVNRLASVIVRNPLHENAFTPNYEDQKYTFEYYDNDTSVIPDKFGYVAKNNLLKKITLPTGGTIAYEYEERRYNFYYELDFGSDDVLQQVYTTSNSAPEYLAGMRVSKITVDGKVDDNPDIVKEFSYGEGVRIDNNYEAVTSNLGSTKGYTNRIMGHVGHRWVEVKDSEGGFTKTYYTSGISHPTLHYGDPVNSIYGGCYVPTVDLPNHCPSFINEEEAFSIYHRVNPHSQFSSREAYLSFSEAYGKVYKTETGYYTGVTPTITDYSDSKWIRFPSDQPYPLASTSDVRNASSSAFVYKVFDKVNSDGKEVTTYYTNHDIAHPGRTFFHSDHQILSGPGTIIKVDSDSTIVTHKWYLGNVAGSGVYNVNTNMINYQVGEVTQREVDSQYGGLLTNLLIDLNGDGPTVPPKSDPGMTSVAYWDALYNYGGYRTDWDNSDGKYRPRETWAYTESHLLTGDYPDNTNGRLIQTFDAYDTMGNLLQTSDGLSVKTSYDYTDDGLLVGAFSNADKDDVFSHSFAYEGLTGWNAVDAGSNPGSAEFSISDGKLKIKSNGNISTAGERDYIGYDHGSEISPDIVWEFDVKIADSDQYDLQMSAGGSGWDFRNAGTTHESAVWTAIQDEEWRVRNSSTWVTLKSGLVIGETYNFKIVIHSNTNTADYYIDGEELATGISFFYPSSGIQKIIFGHYGHSTLTSEWYIDNVRLYPETAQASSQELDYYTLKPLAVKGVGGETQRFEYDGFGRLSTYSNAEDKLANAYNYSYSTVRNSGTFTESDPNAVESITYLDPLYTTDFTHPTGWSSVTSHNAFNIQMAGERTVRMGSGGSYETMIKSIGSTEVVARIDFYPDNTTGGIPHIYLDGDGNRFAVHYLESSDRFRIQYRKSPTTSYTYPFTFPLDAPHLKWYTIELEKVGDQLTAWVYPKGEGRDSNNSYSLGGFSASWTPDFRLTGNDNYYYAANLSIATSSLSSVSFSDGVGRSIQTQVRGGSSTVISDTRYDGRGLTVAVSKPHLKANQDTYLQNAFEGTGTFTPSGVLHSGSAIQDYWDGTQSTNDANYAYSYTEYEQSMTNRVLSSTLPGYSHRDGAGAESNMSYGLNSVAISTPNDTWAVNSLFKTISEDQNGKKNITYTSYLGRTIASGVDMNNDSKLTTASTDLITTFEYNHLGHLILVTDPEGLETTYKYNALGELLEKKLPDQDHANKYCYDDNGKLRFQLDPVKVANPTYYYSTPHYDYIYNKYDVFGRVVEIGEQQGFTSSNATETSFDLACGTHSFLNDQNEPNLSSYISIKARYFYDGDGAYTGARNLSGKLTKVQYLESLGYLNNPVWGYSYYSYNSLGQVEWIVQDIPGLANDIKITYTYDSAGKLLEMGYNVTNSSDDHYFWYEYDELGRLEFVYSDTDSNPAGRIKESENSSYLADGLVTQMKLGNSNVQTVDYTYTMQGWLDKVNAGSVSSATNGDRFALDLNYNLNGTIGTQIWRQSSISTSYGVQYGYSYDNANRLTLANFTDLNQNSYDDNHNGYDVTYGYDDNGNITTLTRNGQGSLYSAYPQYSLSSITIPGTNNRLTSYGIQTGPVSPTTHSVTYDASGNMIKNRFTNAGYDWRNRMTDVTKGSNQITFGYDNNGDRIRKEVVGGIETHYVRGAGGETIAVYENGSRAFVNLLAGSKIIGNYDGTQRRYFLKDHLGNIRTTVDQSGNVDGYDDYYPFGSVMPGRSSNTSNPDDLYKFTGHERDDEAGLDLDYMMARNYDPVIGRFVQIDPLSDQFPGWTPYHYVHNNPLNLIDPTGMMACEPPNDCPLQSQAGEANHRDNRKKQAQVVAQVASSPAQGLLELFSPTSMKTTVTVGSTNKYGVETSVTGGVNTDLSESVFEPQFSPESSLNFGVGPARVSIGGNKDGATQTGSYGPIAIKNTEEGTSIRVNLGKLSFGYNSSSGFYLGGGQSTPLGEVYTEASYKPSTAIDRTKRNVITPLHNNTVGRVTTNAQKGH